MMDEQQQMSVAIDESGELGFLDLAIIPASATANANLLAVRLGNGATVFVAPEQLREIETNKYRFAGSFETLRRQTTGQTETAVGQQISDEQNSSLNSARINNLGETIVPLIAEEIQIGKKAIETGGVRVHKTVRENVETIDEPIIREHLTVERVEINKFVETAPAIRYEGDVMVVPVLEEVIVTQKRLFLREEVRLTKRREEISNPQQIVLRREEISLEKIEPDKTGQ